ALLAASQVLDFEDHDQVARPEERNALIGLEDPLHAVLGGAQDARQRRDRIPRRPAVLEAAEERGLERLARTFHVEARGELAARPSTIRRWLSWTKRWMTASVTSCSSVYSVVAFSNSGTASVLRWAGKKPVLVE